MLCVLEGAPKKGFTFKETFPIRDRKFQDVRGLRVAIE